jgi:hypothetical protein
MWAMDRDREGSNPGNKHRKKYMWVIGKDQIQESTPWPRTKPGIITSREIHGGHESIQYI